MPADPWTSLAMVFDRDAGALRARAAVAVAGVDASALVLEAERLEASADRQRELAVFHGCGIVRWSPGRSEPAAGSGAPG